MGTRGEATKVMGPDNLASPNALLIAPKFVTGCDKFVWRQQVKTWQEL